MHGGITPESAYQGCGMKIACVVAVLALSAGQALADTTVVYEAQNGAFKMTIEIAANGDVRGDVKAKPGSYFITRNGEGFVVQSTSAGVVVDRIADLSQAMAKVASENMPDLKAAGSAFSRDGSPMRFFAQGGTVSVNGRSGTAYFWKSTKAAANQPPVAVISLDPTLAPVGQAMARQFEMSEKLSSAIFGGVLPPEAELDEILKSGAPLAFAGAQLTSISNAPIAPSRFELPGPPESPAAIEKRIRASGANGSFVAF